MKMFKVTVEEILRRTLYVEAEDCYDAEDKAATMIANEEVVLDADDFVERNYKTEKTNLIKVGRTTIDMWYGDKFEPGKYGADAYFSDCDCLYRGNIYNSEGKIIGDYESESSTVDDLFQIRWKD